MPLVAAATARSDRSRLARHRPGQSLPAAGSAGAVRAVCVLRRSRRRLGAAHPQLFLWACIVYFAAGVAIVVGGRRLLPNCVRPRSCTPWSTRSPSVCSCSRAAASRAASASCSWCRWAPWRCWRTTAMRSCWPRSPRWRCSRSRSARHVTGTADVSDYPSHRHPGRHRVPGRAARLAARAPPARQRGHGAPPAGRPRQPRAAVAVHRAAPAREHPGRRPREPHPADQRIRRAAARRPQRLSGRAAGRGLAAAALSTRDLARSAPRRRRPAQTFVAADGGHVVQPHFALARRPEPAPVIVFLEDTELLAAKIQQSKLAALGRLSASIAHEIRNPVGAMSHAAQLLAESASLSAEDKRLTEIVRTNGDRVRQIIDNVHVDGAARELAARAPDRSPTWLAGFRDEFCATMQIAPRRGSPSPRCSATSRCGSTHAAAPDRLEPVRERREIRRQRDRQRRASSCASAAWPRRARPFLEVADRGPGIAVAASRDASSSRSSPATSAARASACSWRASSPRPTAPLFFMSRAPAAAACSAWCSAIRSAGWRDAAQDHAHGATARTHRRRRARPGRARDPHAVAHELATQSAGDVAAREEAAQVAALRPVPHRHAPARRRRPRPGGVDADEHCPACPWR